MLISGIYKLKLPVGNYKVSHRNTVREDKGYKGGNQLIGFTLCLYYLCIGR